MAGIAERKNRLWFLAALLLSAAGLFMLASLTSGLPWEALRQLPTAALGAAALLVLGLWLVEALRIKLILRLLQAPLAFRSVLQINLATAFAAAITPAASGGPLAQVLLLRRAGVPAERGLALVAARMAATLVFFALAAPATIILLGGTLSMGRVFQWLVPAAGLLLAALAAALFYVMARPYALQPVLTKLLKLPWLRRLAPDGPAAPKRIAGRVAEFGDSLRLFLRAENRGATLAVVLLTVAYWGCFFGIAPVLLAGLGRPFSPINVLARQLVLYFTMAYVPLPGASGVAELGMAGLFSPLLPETLLTGFVLVWRFYTYYLNILVGGPILWLLGRPRRKI